MPGDGQWLLERARLRGVWARPWPREEDLLKQLGTRVLWLVRTQSGIPCFRMLTLPSRWPLGERGVGLGACRSLQVRDLPALEVGVSQRRLEVTAAGAECVSLVSR